MITITRSGIVRAVKATELPYWKSKGYVVVEAKQEQPVIVPEEPAGQDAIAEQATAPEDEAKAPKKASKKRK